MTLLHKSTLSGLEKYESMFFFYFEKNNIIPPFQVHMHIRVKKKRLF